MRKYVNSHIYKFLKHSYTWANLSVDTKQLFIYGQSLFSLQENITNTIPL